MPISLNVLAQSVHDRARLVEWFTAARPPWAVVMDELDTAARVRMASPNTRIIFRRYWPDDHKLAEVMTPAQFLLSVADVPAPYWVQAGNEPGGDQTQLSAWLAQVMALATAQGRKLAVGNWSVGNPDEELVQAGQYDAVLRGLAGSEHVLGLHEYFWQEPAQEPWFVGRYRHWLQRADKIGIPRPPVVMTEHGTDLAGGHDGWRSKWDEETYAAKLEQAQTVYNADGVTACVFCWGDGHGRWATYDVQDSPDLLRRMAEMNGDDAMVPGYRRATTKTPNARVNLRAAPSIKAGVVGAVVTGDYVKPLGNPVLADGYTWQQIALDKDAVSHQHGFIALEVLDIGG